MSRLPSGWSMCGCVVLPGLYHKFITIIEPFKHYQNNKAPAACSCRWLELCSYVQIECAYWPYYTCSLARALERKAIKLQLYFPTCVLNVRLIGKYWLVTQGSPECLQYTEKETTDCILCIICGSCFTLYILPVEQYMYFILYSVRDST